MTSYFDLVKPSYIESWPDALCRLSIAQVDVPLTVEDAIALGTNMVELYETFPEPWERDISGIRTRVANAVHKFPRGAFIRLGSRSPKDSFFGFQSGFHCSTGKHAMNVLLSASERVQQDLQLAIDNRYSPHIFVREWVDLEPWQEFRCFMKDRNLVGISQYQYLHGPMKEIRENHAPIEWAIRTFFEKQFRDASHLDSVVFDVFVNVRTLQEKNQMGVRAWSVKLLEINPFFEMTDPCLFDWRNGGNFDGSFRLCLDGERPKDGLRKYSKEERDPQ